MTDESQSIDRLSPDKLVLGFSKSKILIGLLIAIGAHLFVIGATSVTYIRDRWVDPEGAARRKEEVKKAKEAEAARRAEAAEKAAPASATPTEGAKAPATATAAAKTKGEKELDRRKEAPVVKEITEMPKKGEVPKAPDELGISIDETNK